MKLWVDDLRPAPEGYIPIYRTLDAIEIIKDFHDKIEEISLDHDAGEFADCGGDYIKILDAIEKLNYNIPIHIHTANPVGAENMRRIIKRNGWKEVFH